MANHPELGTGQMWTPADTLVVHFGTAPVRPGPNKKPRTIKRRPGLKVRKVAGK